MKKLFAVLLILTMTLTGLTACGTDSSGDAATGGDGQAAAENNNGNASGESIDADAAIENAKEVALADAGITEDQTIGIGLSQEFDDGITQIEVDLYTTEMDYSYSIKADDGTILEKETSVPSKVEDLTTDTNITPAQAAETALAQVEGATSDNLRIQYEFDDGMSVYEIEIIYDGTDYEIEIDANSGDIIQSSQEPLSLN